VEYAVQIKCQHTSHGLIYNDFSKGRKFPHLALVGLNIYKIIARVYRGNF
jgi:hypothetical protein